MPSTAIAIAPVSPRSFVAGHPAGPEACGDARQRTGRHINAVLRLFATLALKRRIVRDGDVIYRVGEQFDRLYVLNSGFFKSVNLSPDGREQVVGLKFRGDWLGFDGIASRRYSCDAIAMDTGEIWGVRYDMLLAACAVHPELLAAVYEAMSREIARDHDSLMSVCTLPADARVADFLCNWSEAMASRGMRTDQISLRMSRAEIGSYLGMTLESVSRALSRLARNQLIDFAEKDRRAIRISCLEALAEFVQKCLSPASATLQ